MKPQNERIALATAATLLKQARRVLRHANDAQAAMIKQALERVLPVLPPELEAPEPDEQAFFSALDQVHGAEFADEARDGEKPPQPAPSANEASLQQQLSEMRKSQEELLARLNELQKPVT
jgi:uncharacterized protein HemX